MPQPARPGFDLDDCTFGSCVLELADFVHAVQEEPRTRGLLRWATALGVVACLGGLWLVTGPRALTGCALLAFGLICFAMHQAPEHVAQRWFEKTPKAARSLRYTINSRELIVSSEVSHTVYGWPNVLGFHEAPRVLLIWVSATLFLIVPKRAFPAEGLPKVLAELQRQELGPPPTLPRFWSWLLLAVVIGGGALFLWNRLAPR